jgi:hypothetical protein
VRPGVEPDPAERWDLRAPLLCEALARGEPALGRPCLDGLIGTRPMLRAEAR